eukprot:2957114-Alexandrium_andersonii.AAC.1
MRPLRKTTSARLVIGMGNATQHRLAKHNFDNMRSATHSKRCGQSMKWQAVSAKGKHLARGAET